MIARWGLARLSQILVALALSLRIYIKRSDMHKDPNHTCILISLRYTQNIPKHFQQKQSQNIYNNWNPSYPLCLILANIFSIPKRQL